MPHQRSEITLQVHDGSRHTKVQSSGSSRLMSSLLVIFVCFCTFGNSIQGNFVFDDSEAILNNKDVLPDSSLWNLIQNDFWGLPLTHNRSHKSYRPITVLTFRWNHWMAGGFEPISFHLTNVILHALVSVLIIPIVDRCFSMTWPHTSLLAALLFSVHPVHTEAVAGVVGRADLLSAFFSFLSFLVYALAAERNDFVASIKTLLLLILSMLLCMLALFSKEQGIAILGVCSTYDILILHRLNPMSFLPSMGFKRSSNQRKAPSTTSAICASYRTSYDADHHSSYMCCFMRMNGKVVKSLLFRQCVLIVSGSSFLILRWRIMGSKTPIFHSVDNPASFADSLWTRVWSYNYIYSLNAWLLICPEWLCFDWSMGCVPLISTMYDVRLLSVIALYIVLLGLVVQGLCSLHSLFGRNIIISLAFVILPFLPASNIFFRVGFVLAERVLYVPSLGLCMLVVLGLQILIKNNPHLKKVIWSAFCGLLVLYCVRSIHRNSQWHDESTLFRSCLPVCPQNAKVHYNVAKNAGDSGDRKLAVNEYKIAIRLYPRYAQAMNNLANILRDEGDLIEAEILLKTALRIKPDFPAAWMNLGIVLAGRKQYHEAEQCYRTALMHRSFYPDCFYNLGNLYLDQQRFSEASEAWRNATYQKPTFSLAWNNLVIMLENLGDSEQAKTVALEGLAILPNDAGLHFNLGNLLGKLQYFEEAELHFKRAIELDPLNAVYHSNMGVLYHRWKKYELAELKYKSALKIHPNLKSAITNLNMLKQILKP